MAISRGSKIFLVVLAVVAGLVIGAVTWVNHLLGGEPGPGDPVRIEVAQGADAGSIGDTLAEQEVVRSSLAFSLRARSRGLADKLLAGEYEFETGMSVDEAIEVLLDGPVPAEVVRFTVEEGLPVTLVLDRLAEQTPHERGAYQQVVDDQLSAPDNASGPLELPGWVPELSSFGPEVRQPMEGLLFPETYEVLAEATPTEILQRMVDELAARMDEIPDEQVESFTSGELTRYDALIIGSLIERETRVNDERDTVSGVIRNRLAEGQRLQIDATVLYARGEHTERVLTADTEIESPYNTYQVAGLPPTPIANMGEASLRAAFAPADVEFFYYVLSPECDGTHVFARTLDEHNRNVQAFRDAGRCAS